MKNFVRELTKLFHRWPFCSRVLPPISCQPCPLYLPNCQPLVSLLAARRRTCPAGSGLARGPSGTVSWHCRRWVGPSPPGRGLCVWWWCEVGEVWVGGGGGGRCFVCQEDNLAELFVNIFTYIKRGRETSSAILQVTWNKSNVEFIETISQKQNQGMGELTGSRPPKGSCLASHLSNKCSLLVKCTACQALLC